MKKLLTILLVLILASAACAEGVPDNWYEVFVRSYQDSDGDGLGDLNGLRSRLDYIEDMGWRGLWLMPIMPSPSYHKYDVTDYRAVDGQYGTLEDLRALLDDAHARGISVILDMPVNHTSTLHPWSVEAAEALANGDGDSPYIDYYNFNQTGGSGFAPLGDTGWFYEEAFAGGGMPDLNLDNPDVREALRGIFDFWLNDVGCDGFRLDAVTSYYTGEADRNIEFLAWVKATCEALKPGCYLVGECWTNLNTIADYYQSGVDSFFLFPAAQAEGFIAASLQGRSKRAEKFAGKYGQALDAIPEGRLAPFLCNHDTGRTVGLVQGRSNPAVAKFAEGVLGMLGGSVFTYYGEEIGMVGSGDDPDKRLAMYWSEDDMTDQPPGTTAIEYAYPSVEDQLSDPDSLLHYVRAVNHARLDHPEIASGKNIFEYVEGDLCLMRRETADAACLIAMNFSPTEAGQIPLDGDWTIAADLETGEEAARLDGGALIVPPYGIVVLKIRS